MIVTIISMLLRRLLIVILAQQVVSRVLGPEIVETLLGDGTAGWVVSIAGSLALILYSFWDRILIKLRLKAAIISPPSTTVAEVKQEVTAVPTVAKVVDGFSNNPRAIGN